MKSEKNYPLLVQKYRRQRDLFVKKREYLSELREMYQEMGLLYRELKHIYTSATWELASSEPGTRSSGKVLRIHELVDRLNVIREKCERTYQEMNEFQQKNQGWLVWHDHE